MIVPGYYQHYKGGIYEVVGTALHENTHEVLVLYQPLQKTDVLTADFWARPQTQFLETVVYHEQTVPRFTFLGTTLDDANDNKGL